MGTFDKFPPVLGLNLQIKFHFGFFLRLHNVDQDLFYFAHKWPEHLVPVPLCTLAQ